MDATQLGDALDAAIAGRRLLEHPFYLRWQAGELSRDELASYAEQYRHFEASLPAFLEDLRTQLSDAPAACELLGRNLHDEAGGPVTHVQLFDDFGAAVGASPDAAPSPAMTHLLSTYAGLAAQSAELGLAALVAYEVQAPEVATSKAAGLRDLYGLNAAATQFWDVHSLADIDHATWSRDALAGIVDESGPAAEAARTAATAWWSFLDEREAARPA